MSNAITKQKSHSSFWMGRDADELADQSSSIDSIGYVNQLRKVQRATGNFIKIVTGKEIPVIFSSGKSSYTDGSKVVLSADLDPAKMDSLVGTALHEGAHCLLSTKSLAFLHTMHNSFEALVKDHEILTHAARLGIPIRPMGHSTNPEDNTKYLGSVYEHVQIAMNVLEDRRIDLWMYKNAPGYQPYYDAMYDLYWHSPKIDRALQDSRCHEAVVENYLLHMINITNEHVDVTKMPQLADLRRIVNLTETGLFSRGDEDPGFNNIASTIIIRDVNTRFAKLPRLFTDAVRMVELMYKNSTKVERSENPEPDGQEDGGNDPGDLPNLDGGVPRRLTSEELKELRELIRNQVRFLKGDIDKGQISDKAQRLLDQLTTSNASIVDVEGDFLPRNVKARVVIYRDLTKKVVSSPTFPFRYQGGWYGSKSSVNPGMNDALTRGIKQGAILAQRIRVIQDESQLKFSHQKHGRLDKRRVAALGFANEDVFSFMVTEKRKPANIWLDVDFSGSMQGSGAEHAMSLAIAIAYAAEKTRTLNVTIAVRDGGDSHARVAILYDSRRHGFRQLREIVPYLDVCGGTPESLVFEAIKDEMMKMYKDERKFFINLSDGAPGHSFEYKGRTYMYGGDSATKHCRQLMRDFRAAGIHVMSYFVSSYSYGGNENSTFREMYGQDARFIDVNNIGQITNTLNKLLLEDDN